MRHKKDIRKLGRNKAQRKSLIRNMAISFFAYQKIETTEAKAKELRRTVERLITMGKKQDLASIRRISSFLNHAPSVKKVQELGQKYRERSGGYTQVIKTSPRRGDASEMAILQLIG